MNKSIKTVGIIGAGLDKDISLNLLKEYKSIHIKTKDELTDENVSEWIKDGVMVVIIDSDGTRLEHPLLHINDKPFVITQCKYEDPENYLTQPNKDQIINQKDHYRSIQNKHSFKNNYKPYRK